MHPHAKKRGARCAGEGGGWVAAVWHHPMRHLVPKVPKLEVSGLAGLAKPAELNNNTSLPSPPMGLRTRAGGGGGHCAAWPIVAAADDGVSSSDEGVASQLEEQELIQRARQESFLAAGPTGSSSGSGSSSSGGAGAGQTASTGVVAAAEPPAGAHPGLLGHQLLRCTAGRGDQNWELPGVPNEESLPK
jgi:hypothetical protein